MPKSKQQLRSEQAAVEEAALLKAKMDEAGLSYVETADPDSELDNGKGLWYTLRSLWPGTAEYYEAQQAEMEMDDLTRLKKEVVKANDLVALAKNDYESALEQLLADTKNDFFFFNKIKYKMEEEGKWEFQPPKASMFGDTNDVERRRNRIRRAFKATLPTSEAMESASGSMMGVLGGNSMEAAAAAAEAAVDNEPKPCSWRGKNRAGEFLQCNNMRMYHPTLKVMTKEKKETPKQMQTCGYHATECVSAQHEVPSLIKAPNADAFCSECYMAKPGGGKLQAGITMETCPGVCALSLIAKPAAAMGSESRPGTADGEGVATGAAKLLNNYTEDSKCEWKPSKKDIKLRGWCCACNVIKHPETKAYQNVCGMHVKVCLRKHTGQGSAEVTIPNIHGLCVMHHTADFGEPPKETAFPYPGMFFKKTKAQWAAANHHWAAPKFPFSRELEVAEYEAPDEPEDFIQKVIHAGKMAKFELNKRKLGKAAATKCQSFFRRYRVLGLHIKIKNDNSKRLRIEAALAVGRQMRRFLATKFVRKLRAERTKAAIAVQSRYRGYLTRKNLHILRSRRRIYKFTMKLRFFKFRDTLVTMMQLKKMFRRRNKAAVEIQRMCRGKIVRLGFHYVRLRHFVTHRAARTLQRRLKALMAALVESRIRKATKFVYPSDEWARRQCGKKLAQLIWEKMQDRKSRQQLAVAYNEAAPNMQQLVRGFLGRQGTKRMRFIQQAMRTWCKPELAQEFLRQFYIDHLFYMKKPPPKPPTPPKRKELDPLRKLLPEKYAGDIEVDNLVFDAVLLQYYQNKGVPLLTTELDAIKRTFANPSTRRVELVKLEIYMAMHSEPCRKHGRLICGSCYFVGKCLKPNCGCGCYIKSGSVGSVCKDCYHPPDMHRKAPLQHREKVVPKTMLAIMNNIRDPDTSIPSVVVGVQLHDAVVPPPDPDDKRMARIVEADDRNRRWKEETARHRMSKLSTRLAYLEESGSNIAQIREYWGQRDTNVLTATGPDEPSATADVTVYEVGPDIHDVTQAQFWESAAKNPNKSLRDYDERFEHNMPMPVVRGAELVWTFEGRLVYLNLLHQCVQMEFKIDYDHPDFLRLVVDNIQIFERHWRKMVADLRKGQLNRSAKVAPEHRQLFEALALPRPGLAVRLDVAFRKLGFHKKVLGKDIQVTSYAEKRTDLPVPVNREKLVRGRRPSLPSTPGGTGKDRRDAELGLVSSSRGSSRSRSRGGRRSGSRGGSPLGSPLLTTRNSSATSPRSPGFLLEPLTPTGSRGNKTPPSRSGGGSGAGTRGSGLATLGATKKEAMVAVGGAMRAGPVALRRQEEEMRVRGPSRTGRPGSESRTRRGSETDIVRDASMTELFEMNYGQETEPRIGEHLVLGGADLERYICPFPACGQSFKTADLCFKHIPVHENRVRLKAPTALADSHLSAYWPKGLPWTEERKYAARQHVVGTYECLHEGCKKVFASKKELASHVKHEHKIAGPSSVVRGVYQFLGSSMNVPPSHPPVYAPLRYCPNHAHPAANCILCLEIERSTGPQPPFRYYEGVIIDREGAKGGKRKGTGKSAGGGEGKSAATGSRNSTNAGSKKSHPSTALSTATATASAATAEASPSALTVSALDMDKAVVYSAAQLPGEPKMSFLTTQKIGFATAVMLDGQDNGWLGIVPYLTYDAAVAGRYPVERDFDKAYELLFPDPEIAAATGLAQAKNAQLHDDPGDDPYREANRLFSWVPLASVVDTCRIYRIHKAEFRALAKAKKITFKNSYFVRPPTNDASDDDD